ncbi:PilZ domain-containing protein [Methylobacterium sp. J-001]|uniref:PilZ domain-containing protein n=1 Tax=Methylobacterium sp. J-001 TaxID=2836609 RepID=UPI001FB88323|nr:PilZ domain-containing protein [Methylobacterium sp. J-001]MCJ2117126.1 PilZ domain-containing protein [Methylobacterium sp. J-001]
MPEQFHITTKGRYCLHGEADIQCLADVSATDVIELRRIAEGPLPVAEARITCFLDNVGMVDGVVLEARPGGFIFRVVGNPERRSRIDARLSWLRSADGRDDQRQATRIVPVHRAVRVQLRADRISEAVIADLSMTGAALLLSERPEIGTTVTVGKRYATVVRHTPDGVGVAFRMPFGPLTFNERVIL